MGGLLSCCANCFASGGGGEAQGGAGEAYETLPGNVQPDPEERRRQVAEAAERRLNEQEHRGIKNPDSVKRQQKRQEEIDRREEEAARLGGDKPGLKWQMS